MKNANSLPSPVTEFIMNIIKANGETTSTKVMEQLNSIYTRAADGNFRISSGTFYSTIKRLIEGGLVKRRWPTEEDLGVGPHDRRLYSVTPKGEEQLKVLKQLRKSIAELSH